MVPEENQVSGTLHCLSEPGLRGMLESKWDCWGGGRHPRDADCQGCCLLRAVLLEGICKVVLMGQKPLMAGWLPPRLVAPPSCFEVLGLALPSPCEADQDCEECCRPLRLLFESMVGEVRRPRGSKCLSISNVEISRSECFLCWHAEFWQRLLSLR